MNTPPCTTIFIVTPTVSFSTSQLNGKQKTSCTHFAKFQKVDTNRKITKVRHGRYVKGIISTGYEHRYEVVYFNSVLYSCVVARHYCSIVVALA